MKSGMYKSPEKLKIKKELKDLQAAGEAPEWLTWFSWAMLKESYLYKEKTPKEKYRLIAKSAAAYLPSDNKKWEDKFFELMWKGWLSPSTPVMANMGTDRALAVSCSGTYVGDSMWDIAYSNYEIAMLSKYGFGTAAYFDVRPGMSEIGSGGKSNSVCDWIEQAWNTQNKISQGSTRRGSTASYIDFWHAELLDVLPMLEKYDRLHLGIICDDKVREALKKGDQDAWARYKTILTWRARKGKPYIIFIDNAKRQDPTCYHNHGWATKNSNLCSEVFLNSDSDHSFSCVLSSMNGTKFDEWKDTDAVFNAIVFLDCINEDLIQRGSKIPGLERVVRFAKKSRALGLGLLGFHSYLQQNMIPLEGLEARFANTKIFKHMKEEADRATKFLAGWLGEPEICKGYGTRNTHTIAIAPNTSSAFMAGGVSQGIEPIVANVYTQKLAKVGAVDRINPALLQILRDRNAYTEETMDLITYNKGSVQNLDILTDEEKDVFKTAYEVNQKVLIDLAEQRQQWICQGQSLNLFFDANEDEQYIHEVHKHAFEQERLKSLYYVRTMAGISANKDDACLACEG